jgi:hypothetical protein
MISITHLLSLLTLSSSFFLVTSASPLNPRHEFGGVKRQAGPDPHSPYPIVGFPERIEARLEIRDLAANPDQFNIFLLALRKLQEVKEDDFLSYFQIAGNCSDPRQRIALTA